MKTIPAKVADEEEAGAQPHPPEDLEVRVAEAAKVPQAQVTETAWDTARKPVIPAA
jgi:hypothetical protein